MKIQVEMEDSVAGTVHHLIRQMRELSITREDPDLDSKLRDAELALAGSLRSIGWEPNPNGKGWIMRQPAGRRRR